MFIITKIKTKLNAYAYSRDCRGHLGNCMNLVAEMIQGICVTYDLSTNCKV